MIRLILILLLVLMSGQIVKAQVVHDGKYSWFCDGNGINRVIASDSVAWIATDYGLILYDIKSHDYSYVITYSENSVQFSLRNVDEACVDHSGDLVYVDWHDDTLMKFTTDGELVVLGSRPKYHVNTLNIDKTGKIWAGLKVPDPDSDEALAYFEAGEWHYVNTGHNFLSVNGIAFDQNGFPIVSAKSHVLQYDGNMFHLIEGKGSGGNIVVSDSRIATFGSKFGPRFIKYFDGNEWSQSSNEFTHCFFDDMSILYGIDDRGDMYKFSEGLANPVLVKMAPYNGVNPDVLRTSWAGLSDTSVFIARDNGLFYSEDISSESWGQVKFSTSYFSGLHVSDIVSHKDTIWLTQMSGGLFKIVDFDFDSVVKLDSNVSRIEYDIYRNGLWTSKGSIVTLIQNGNTESYDLESIFPVFNSDQEVFDIESDTLGNTWFNIDKGIVKINSSNEMQFFDMGPYRRLVSLDKRSGDLYVFTESVSLSGWLWEDSSIKMIRDDQLVDLSLSSSLVGHARSFQYLQDSSFILVSSDSIHIVKEDTTIVSETSSIAINTNEIIPLNDSTALVCSIFDLEVVQTNGKVATVEIPPNFGRSSKAYPAYLNSDGVLAIARNTVLLIDSVACPIVNNTSQVPEQPNSFVVYPNPFSTFIEAKMNCSDCTLSIVNLEGVLVYESMQKNYDRIDLANYPSGVYFAILRDENQIFSVRKIVKVNEE